MRINFRAFASAAFFLLFYTGARAQNVNKQSFSFQGNVFQQFIVPATGWYYLSTSGGQGGGASNGSHTGGLGATVEGYMQLQTGDTLRIAVAGQGGVGSNDGNNVSGGGGGGSSSIIKIKNKNYIPLLFAAGGGGGNANADGSPGDASQIGSGQGGAVSASPFGGASGAGYFTDGGTHFDGGTLMSYGGQAYLSGNFGGNSGNLGGDGGWGGGGEGGPAKNRFLSNHDGGGGGGGGYDGGVGSDNNGGNGGYSFISDSLNTNFRVRLKGANSGNGKVSIERVQYPNASSQESIFNFQGNVFQTWTVPASGIYHFDVSGAQGGDCMGAPGGKGARMQGKVALIAGDVLRIAVGGQGGAGSSVAPATWGGFSSGGGGGGSSIFKVVGNQLVPLMIAGGGGGSTFRVQDNWYLPADSAEIAFNNFSLGGAGQASSDNNGQGGSIDFRNNVKLAGFATLLKDDAVPAGSGGGLFSSGASWSGFSRTDSSYRPASGGQSYFQGNYGGSGNLGADGGWGGGGEGNTFGYFPQDPIFVTKFGIAAAGDPWGYNPGYYLWGNGGGGGGYSGGSSAGNYLKLDNSHYLSRGGAGGYSYSIASCRNDSSGAQMGNGVIRIAGPTVLVDTVSVVSPTYTWPVNGVTYRHSGTYNYLDQSNCAYRVLNLTIGGLGGCLNYKRIDTTIVSCGTYTSPLNGRTYSENMIDSFEVGCNRYVVKLITSAPATFQEQALPLEVCKDKTISYSIPEVPFATSYQWTLPSGISGSSKTNKIVLKIRDNFKGGTICVSPVNSCGVGKAICRQINVLKDEPKGSLIISGPPAPYISGNYSVTPIKGATTYTWKLSNSQARIVSGQGTAQIQLEAGPGFVGTELSVRASNCEGKGSKAEIVLGTVKEDDDDVDDDDEKDSKKFVNIKGAEAIDLSTSKGMGNGTTSVSISAYPNPTSGKLTVQLPATAQQGRLEVYNKDGQLVQTLKVPAMSQSIPIDLSTKAKGLYLIRYYAGQEMKSFKVVVK